MKVCVEYVMTVVFAVYKRKKDIDNTLSNNIIYVCV